MTTFTSLADRIRGSRHLSARHLSTHLGWNVFGVGIAGFVGVLFCVSLLITARFADLERQNLNQYVARTQAVMADMQAVMRSKSNDWGMWTESYDYLATGDPAFDAENFNYNSMANYHVNLVAYQRFDGALKRSFYFDFEKEAEAPELSRQVETYLRSPEFMAQIRKQPNYQTFARFGDRLVVLSATQVTRSDRSGTPAGFMVFGQEVDADMLSKTLQTPVRYDFATNTAPPFLFTDKDISVGISLPGVDNAPVATLRFDLPRSIMLAGRDLIFTLLAGIALMIAVMAVVLNRRLREIVVVPLTQLQRHVSEIGNSGKLKPIDIDDRPDEIGQLIKGFNEMTLQLSVLRAQLDAQSFAIGKSQSTIGVMHNVRNGLSPLTVILSKLQSDLDFSHQAQVLQTMGELMGDDVAPPRRQQLLTFLQLAFGRLEKTVESGRERIDEANRSLANVMSTVDAMQSDDDGVLAPQDIDVHDLIRTSLTIARHNGKMDIAVEMVPGSDTRVMANPVLLSQVLDNLLTNAVEALTAAAPAEPRLIVRFQAGDDGMLHLDIEDNGDGIAPDRAEQIFERGYSTRTEKQGGLGLHWCANTVNAMGGRLALHSAGPGQGTIARLSLPRILSNGESQTHAA